MSNLARIMSEVNGNTFISMDTTTTPILKGGKSNPMQGRVQKHMTGASIMVFQNKNTNAYKNMVERRLAKEGKAPAFELSPRRWGERVANLPIVEHKGGEYLEVIFLNANAVKVSYTIDGKAIDKADIIGLNERPTEGKQGGLEDKVIIRDFKAESIDRLTVAGKVYTRKDIGA
jgi:hypothetical protein